MFSPIIDGFKSLKNTIIPSSSKIYASSTTAEASDPQSSTTAVKQDQKNEQSLTSQPKKSITPSTTQTEKDTRIFLENVSHQYFAKIHFKHNSNRQPSVTVDNHLRGELQKSNPELWKDLKLCIYYLIDQLHFKIYNIENDPRFYELLIQTLQKILEEYEEEKKKIKAVVKTFNNSLYTRYKDGETISMISKSFTPDEHKIKTNELNEIKRRLDSNIKTRNCITFCLNTFKKVLQYINEEKKNDINEEKKNDPEEPQNEDPSVEKEEIRPPKNLEDTEETISAGTKRNNKRTKRNNKRTKRRTKRKLKKTKRRRKTNKKSKRSLRHKSSRK
jgi:hypothetical protein